jgi:hypothetical protein
VSWVQIYLRAVQALVEAGTREVREGGGMHPEETLTQCKVSETAFPAL